MSCEYSYMCCAIKTHFSIFNETTFNWFTNYNLEVAIIIVTMYSYKVSLTQELCWDICIHYEFKEVKGYSISWVFILNVAFIGLKNIRNKIFTKLQQSLDYLATKYNFSFIGLFLNFHISAKIEHTSKLNLNWCATFT